MRNNDGWTNHFKLFLINNKFVSFLLILLLIGLNILVLSEISYVFQPFVVFFKTVLLPLLFSGVLYYLLNPVVDVLERKKIKRIYSIVGLYLLIALLITVIVVNVVPLIKSQVESLLVNFPAYNREIQGIIKDLVGSGFFNQVQDTLGSLELTENIRSRMTEMLNSAVSSLGGIIGAITETVLALITVPFILFYMLKDNRKLPRYVLGFVPTVMRDELSRIMKEMNSQVSSYIRGQIIVSFCIGSLLYIGYLIIGLDYSLILAVIAALTAIVPYLGPAIAITPALVVAAVTSPYMLLKMIVVWTVVQVVEGKFISPQIMGKAMKIHPITIIFVILTAGNLFGVLGVILAVPGYAVIKVIAAHLFEYFKKQSGLYEPPPSGVSGEERKSAGEIMRKQGDKYDRNEGK